MIKAIKLLLFIILLLIPSLLLGETSKKTSSIHACPDNINSALVGITKSLSHDKLINIDLDACPHIQAEIIRDVQKVVDCAEFDIYFALMNQKTMRIVRNAFYAKRGYKFEDPELQKLFVNYAWYKPTEKADISLTPEEDHRVKLLKSIADKWVVKGYKDDWENPESPLLPRWVKIL